MTSVELDDVGFAALTDKIARERAFGCASYKEKCLRRRIAVRMRARGIHRFADYAALLDRDAVEYERLMDTLTINVTKLFRNWSTFDAVARTVVPILWEGAARPIRGWSAGCSSGEEPYSLAILFHQHAAARGENADAGRVQILASDIDRASLDAARRGQYAEAAFADTPIEVRRRYFSVRPPFEVVPEIRPLVSFERRDLIVDPPPAGMHLIACRNVLIYFDRGTQEKLFQRFHEALVPGGFLVLGKVETLLGPTRSLFSAVDPRERIFRRR
jgi:chemotaxis methyl-accepting protein methylase